LGLLGSNTYAIDLNGKLTKVTQGLAKMLGYPDCRSLLGSNLLSHLYREEDRQVLLDCLKHKALTVTKHHMQWKRSDGQLLWAQNALHPVLDHGGITVSSYTGTVTNVNEILGDAYGLRALCDESPLGYHEIDHNGTVTHVNRWELRLLGFSSVAEMIGKPVWTFVRDRERILSQDTVLAKLSGHTPPSHALPRTYLTKDGSTLPVLCEDRLLFDDDGCIKGIRTILRDLSVRDVVEQVLKEPYGVYLSRLETDLIYVYRTDLEGKIVDANPAFCRIVGASQKDIIGKSITSVLPTAKASAFFEDTQVVTRSESLFESIEIDPTDEASHIQTLRAPVFNASDQVIGIQTAYWRANQHDKVMRLLLAAVRWTQELHQEILKNANDLIYIHDLPADFDGRFTWTNKATERMLGYSPEECLKKKISEIVAREDFHKVLQKIKDKCQSGRPAEERTTYELNVICKDGSYLPVEVSTRLIMYEGRPVAVQGTIRDLRERKRWDRLQDIQRKLALRFQDALPLDERNHLQMEVRRVLCAMTVSDGLKAHRALFFEIVEDRVEGLCAVGPRNLQEVREYAETRAKWNLNFDDAMRGMDTEGFVHCDRLHLDVETTSFHLDSCGTHVVDIVSVGSATTVNLASCCTGEAREFVIGHDVSDVVLVPIRAESKPIGLLLLDCLYPGREGDRPQPSDTVIFADILSSLLTRARYPREIRMEQKKVALHGIRGTMSIAMDSILDLDEEELSPQGVGALLQLRNCAQHIITIIDHADQSSYLHHQQLTSVDINKHIQILIGLRPTVFRGVEYNLRLSTTPALALCDPRIVSHILEELIINAYLWRRRQTTTVHIEIKTGFCAAAGAPIEDIVTETSRFVVLQVSDDGTGLSPEAILHMFDADHGGKRLTLRQHFGLAWVRTALRSQNGDLLVPEQIGKGAKFNILLPMTKP
jgi:PAS domain S-box-containing protein